MNKSTFLNVIIGAVLLSLVSTEIPKLDDERPLAIVRRFKPEVIVRNSDADKLIHLNLLENKGEKLYSGDTLSTEKEGFALVVFMDESIAKVKPSSFLVLYGESDKSSKNMLTRLNLEKGEIHLTVAPQGTNDFEVATSRSLASVKGTRFGSKSTGFYWVDEGQVDVTAMNSGETVSLFKNMFAQVDNAGNNIETGSLTEEEIQNLNEGYDEVDNELIQKQIKLRFRDANGQIREVIIDTFEKEQN